MDNQMTPDEALNILDGICSVSQMGRGQHIQAQMATAILKEIIPVEPKSNGATPETTEESKDATTP